tara:strand:- start:304 stop:540 length:237 start_codon:yes stop_codon:yes gene_type:complete
MRGYFTAKPSGFDKERIYELADGEELITVYIEPMRGTYMGRPLFKVWYKQEDVLVCDAETLRSAGLRHVSYPEAKEAV